MFLEITEDHLNKTIEEYKECGNLAKCCPINQALREQISGSICVHYCQITVIDGDFWSLKYLTSEEAKKFITEVDKYIFREVQDKPKFPVTVELLEYNVF